MASSRPDRDLPRGSMSRKDIAQTRKEMEERRLALLKEVEESLARIKSLLESQAAPSPGDEQENEEKSAP